MAEVDPRGRSSVADVADVQLDVGEAPAANAGEVAPADARHPAIERLLAHEEAATRLPVGLCVGAVVSVKGRTAVVLVEDLRLAATLADHVDVDFVEGASGEGQPVLLQNRSVGGLIVLGVVQGKYPSKVAGQRVEITAASEVVVKSGKSALRLREDGVVDLIGARISASSRGLLRLVGRALRLN